MMKKSLIAGGAVALVLALLFGRSSWSYVTTVYDWACQSAKDAVPIEFEIKRAHKMIKEIDPVIRQTEHKVAREEVDVEKLAKTVETNVGELAVMESQIMKLKNDLERGDSTFVYYAKSGGSKTYTAKQVRTDLTSRFERYKTKEATNEKLAKILTARERGLQAARDQLTAMRSAKRQLEEEVANLEARLKMVEVAKTSSDLNIDDSHLARTRQLISDLNSRIDVEDKLLNADTKLNDEIQLEEPTPSIEEDITKEVTAYFAKDRSESLVKAEK
jgi:chromosome segregation ATPase